MLIDHLYFFSNCSFTYQFFGWIVHLFLVDHAVLFAHFEIIPLSRVLTMFLASLLLDF